MPGQRDYDNIARNVRIQKRSILTNSKELLNYNIINNNNNNLIIRALSIDCLKALTV